MTRVQVEQGWLEGKLVDSVISDKPYYSFKGIPYAAPPVGKLRFKAPQPPLQWQGVKKATEHGPHCPHWDIFGGNIKEGSEDCLYLNVYSPNLKPEILKPVMFYIHGGGFKSGSGDDDFYGPDFLVDQDVVLVTVNYRLEVLGFLCLDTSDVPGNAGLKDQVAALKWVHKNIVNFGGDPENVTIFGQSAGGSSTALHLLSPMSRGLFKNAIIMSGVPFCDWSIPFYPQKRAFALGRKLGLATEDPKELLEFLQGLPVEKLINTNPCILGLEQAISNNIVKLLHFTPVIEKDFGHDSFLLKGPLQYLKTENIIDTINIMFGYTTKEALFVLDYLGPEGIPLFENVEDMVVPRKILNKCTPDKIIALSREIKKKYFSNPLNIDNPKEFVNFLSDTLFVYDQTKFFRLFKQHNKNKCYMYKFSGYSERNFFGNKIKYGVTGTSHIDDVLHLFNSKMLNIPIIKDTKGYKIIKQTCKLFTNFAKHGNPTPDLSLNITWPEYDKDEKYLDIGEKLTQSGNDVDDVISFWDKVYEMAGGPYESYIWK